MKSMIAFMKKEWMEQLRSSKVMILGILFVLFGVMNPAVAKLTPWLLELMSESLAESGMVITGVTIGAMDSWVQFFKNIPMALIVFILLESNIFTKEYQTGTLLLSLTKGLSRYQIVISKALMLVSLWTLGYFLCFGITYAYNAYFWDNSVASSLLFSVFCWWLFGLFVIALSVLFSVIFLSNTGVLVGTGSVVFALSMIGLLPKVKKYLPTFLTDGNSLIYGLEKADAYIASLVIAAFVSALCFAVSIPIFNKKSL